MPTSSNAATNASTARPATIVLGSRTAGPNSVRPGRASARGTVSENLALG